MLWPKPCCPSCRTDHEDAKSVSAPSLSSFLRLRLLLLKITGTGYRRMAHVVIEQRGRQQETERRAWQAALAAFNQRARNDGEDRASLRRRPCRAALYRDRVGVHPAERAVRLGRFSGGKIHEFEAIELASTPIRAHQSSRALVRVPCDAVDCASCPRPSALLRWGLHFFDSLVLARI